MANFPRPLIIGFIGYWVFIYLLYRRYKNKSKQPKQEPRSTRSRPYQISHNFFTLLRRKKGEDKELIQSLRKGGNNPKYRKQGDTRSKEEIQEAINKKMKKNTDWREDYI